MGIIQRQSLKNLLSAYAGILLGFFSLFVLQPRLLTPEELGLTRLLFSFSFLIATFVPFGINVIINKYFPYFNNPDKRHHGFLGFAMLITLTGIALGFFLLWLLKPLVLQRYAQQSGMFVEYFSYVFPMVFALACTNTLTSYLFVRLKTTIPPFVNDVVVRLCIIALVVCYHWGWMTQSGFFLGFVVVYLIQLVLLLTYLYSQEKPGWKVDWSYLNQQPLKSMFGFGLMMWTGTLAAVGLKELSTVMLGQYMSLEHIAIYAIAAFIPTVIEAPMGALEKIAAPKITFAWSKNDMSEIAVIYKKSVHNLILIGGLLFVGINTNIVDLLTFLPSNYASGYVVVWIISFSSLCNMTTGLNNTILLYSSKYKPGAWLLIGLVLMNFSLQVLLVPRYGIIGAAIATALSQILFNLFNFLLVWRYFHLQPLDKDSALIFLLILVCTFIGYFSPVFESMIGTIVIRSTLISLVYLAAVYRLNLAPDVLALIKSKLVR